MGGATREAVIVVLLDGQGRVVWVSEADPLRAPGEVAQAYVREDCRAAIQTAVEQVVRHQRQQELQVVAENGDHFRVWIWPLDSPDVAGCALCIYLPEELARLTNREQDCLKLLSYGLSAGKIAEQLQIGTSTVHTHLRRAREKLNLPTLEALISFAARHCDTFANLPGEHPGSASAGNLPGGISPPMGLFKHAREVTT